jgi:hypothetical protein
MGALNMAAHRLLRPLAIGVPKRSDQGLVLLYRFGLALRETEYDAPKVTRDRTKPTNLALEWCVGCGPYQ